jgi:hypothetical protein
MSMIETIKSAIKNREEISFTYSGLHRVVQPTAVGVSSAGNEILRCYQIEGGHITSGHVWDVCTVSKIQNLEVTGKKFNDDPPGYKPGDKGMSDIYAEL